MPPSDASCKASDEVIVVSGLPRSGTSMMMRMLAAGGIPVLVDGVREADTDNPHGYFEFEPVKRLKRESDWVANAAGKAVKVISSLLPALPEQHRYRVIFMRRPLVEVLASQRHMLAHRGVSERGATADDAHMTALFEKHLAEMERFFETSLHMTVLYVDYREVIADPAAAAARLSDFLGGLPDVAAAATAVDGGLYRRRSAAARDGNQDFFP